MQHRTFLAINLPENLRKKLSDYQEKWPELPIRWTKKENLHITLLFIGSVSDQDIPEICRITREIASHHPVFGLNLTKISYGPPKKMPPRMVWAAGQESEEIGKLQKDLESSLFTPLESPAIYPVRNPLRKDKTRSLNRKSKVKAPPFLTGFTSSFKTLSESGIRLFAPHITLGRIRQWDFLRIEPEEQPEVEEDVSFVFEVSSIEVMESHLKRGGPEYTILESCPLRN